MPKGIGYRTKDKKKTNGTKATKLTFTPKQKSEAKKVSKSFRDSLEMKLKKKKK